MPYQTNRYKVSSLSMWIFSRDLVTRRRTKKSSCMVVYSAESCLDNNMNWSVHKDPVLRSKSALKSESKCLSCCELLPSLLLDSSTLTVFLFHSSFGKQKSVMSQLPTYCHYPIPLSFFIFLAFAVMALSCLLVGTYKAADCVLFTVWLGHRLFSCPSTCSSTIQLSFFFFLFICFSIHNLLVHIMVWQFEIYFN